ncbi:MAG: ArsR/SmtB family transcription factor [Asticcacaulis sp.]
MSNAELFAALGDETRLAIVAQLGAGPASIVQLTKGRPLTRQALTKHLHVLERTGLVCHARSGRETLWSLRRQRLDEARAFLDLMSRQWDERLDRLRSWVED